MESGFALPHQLNPNLPGMSNQGTQHTSSHASQTISPSTLLIRHLPEAIPLDTLSRLFSHYGASSVRPLSGGRLRNSAFVDFKDEASAFQAHRQFNGLRFLGKVLSVEKASKNIHDDKHLKSESEKDSTAVARDVFKGGSFPEASKSGCVPAGEPIAEKVGVDYPFPPHIEYSYPPPDGNILTNIVNALIAVPRFYTQVLHLMNKMNIPAPFRPALPTPPLPNVGQSAAPPPPPPPPITENPSPAIMSSDESEMETSEEEVDDGAQARRKRIKRENIVGPAVDKDVAHEAVGLKPATLVPKEVPVIKKKNPVLQIKIAPKQIQPENMAKSVAEEPDEVTEVVDDKAFATAEEIGRHKLPPEELLSLPMFKNYSSGNPACVLYIKNLAKDVVVDDFFFIFGSLFGSISAAKSVLGVRLMQEGRMRGQAFLTFPSVELAHHALNLVNGYVFKGKPMIIQFGRNPAASKAS